MTPKNPRLPLSVCFARYAMTLKRARKLGVAYTPPNPTPKNPKPSLRYAPKPGKRRGR